VRFILYANRGASAKTSDVEVVGVKEEPDQWHLIIRLLQNIGDHKGSWSREGRLQGQHVGTRRRVHDIDGEAANGEVDR
jgi:hypothetical protein